MGDRPPTDLRLFGTLVAAEGAAGFVALQALRGGAPGPLGIGLLILAAALTFAVRRYLRSADRRASAFTAAMNLASLLLLFVAGELMVRLAARPSPAGPVFLDTLLLPRSWPEVAARNRALLRERPSSISYFVSDELLGWTIGQSRTSKDGLYSSSREGLRSARPGDSLAERQATRRIALVGDSFTFGLEVPFEETWASRLEPGLPPGSLVLNFGVDGYGLDQAFLRFDRDAIPWHPALVVLGFVNHDLQRTMVVYPFVSFPQWGFPFSKPRLVPRDGRLVPLNLPLLAPEALFDRPSIDSLPFLIYEPGYHAEDWRRRAYHASWLARAVVSRFPAWPAPRSELSQAAAVELNVAILREFVTRARAAGIAALVVRYPSRDDFRHVPGTGGLRYAVQAALRRAGIECLDMGACLEQHPADEVFLAGRQHYSPRGNALLAGCLLPHVLARLDDARSRP
ncbi:MAG TPA: hypothetical protein VJS92_03515 [Candidatus Polarisedimenticolaceae bacterium]|nr:hypothetical protein [Candidatus Polarisedimenticolaceae bacterium]